MNRDITLLHVVEHLSVVLNTIADEESRVMRDQTDWMPQGFSQESTEVGPTGGGHVCRFFSWRPDPEAEALDAFNQDWGSLQRRRRPFKSGQATANKRSLVHVRHACARRGVPATGNVRQ